MSLPASLGGRRFIRAMVRFGWHVVRQRGSHRRIPKTAVRRTLKQAGIDELDFLTAL